MATDTYTLKSGMWSFPKNPADEAYYGVDVSDLLPVGVTIVATPAPPTAVVVGVTLIEGARIQGNEIVAKLGGLDVSKGDDTTPADNMCTFGFYISTGEHFYRSIHFYRKDK